MNGLELTGRARTHLALLDEPVCTLHAQAVTAFMGLRRAARTAGFDLKPVSSFRDFDRQLFIWNAKYHGARPLYAADGALLNASRLSPAERIDAILLWSALPGASRHHWGTDVDLIDAGAVVPGYEVQLTPEEFAPPGPFAPLLDWLDTNASRFGFFRPYRGALSGVRPEPWHFSFAPVAEAARRALAPPVLADALAHAPLMGKEHVMARLEELHARYVAAIDWP